LVIKAGTNGVLPLLPNHNNISTT